ncbi:hypothetical protein CAPTEDRAFT_90733, partial [Capitella teleta]
DIFRFSQEKFGPHVEIVVNCAGILNEQDWHLCVQVNIVGSILITKCAIEHMSKAEGGRGGCVVHFSSVVGMSASEYSPIYSATKHAILGLTRSYGTERQFEQHGVLFNCVCPGAVDTDMVSKNAVQRTLFPEEAVSNSNDLMLWVYFFFSPDRVATVVMDLIANDEMNGQAMMISLSRGVEQVKFPQIPHC